MEKLIFFDWNERGRNASKPIQINECPPFESFLWFKVKTHLIQWLFHHAESRRTHLPGSVASASSKLVRSSPPSKPRWLLLSQLPECHNCKIRRKEGKLEKESKQTTNYLGHCSFWASQFWLVRRFKGFQLEEKYLELFCLALFHC